jgi:DNA-directed RNA polymerase subunit H
MPGGKRSSPREDLPLRFNVLEHQLVPEHRLVAEEEAERVLKALKITRDQLPKIRKSDPVIQVLEKIEGPIEEGRIVRVTRVSGTAGVSEAYRLVIGR